MKKIFFILFLETLSNSVFAHIGTKSIRHHIDTVDAFISHPKYELPLNRPVFSCNPVQQNPFRLHDFGTHINWEHSMECTHDKKQQSAHFFLKVLEHANAACTVGAVIYLAGEQARKDGTYDIRIDITQTPPDSAVRVYDSQGVLLDGPIPLRPRDDVELKKPFLPWRDGMIQYYSVVCEPRDGRLYVLLIQHTREEIHQYEHTSPLIREIVGEYSYHERLRNRPHAFLEMPQHMRCLPIPYSHKAYAALADGKIYVAWASLCGVLEAFPA